MLNIGCDIESVKTFRQKWKAKEFHFFERVFSPEEITYCKKFKDPSPHFAARFCAKEAVVKAANKKCKLLVTDIQIQHTKNGAPAVHAWKKRNETKVFLPRIESSCRCRIHLIWEWHVC